MPTVLQRAKERALTVLYVAGVMSMSRRAKIMAGIVVACVLVYVLFFSGLFHSNAIGVVAELRVESAGMLTRGNPRAQGSGTDAAPVVYGVFFALDKPYALTAIRVYASADWDDAGEDATPTWALVATDPQAPETIDGFRYGRPVRGMKPADPQHARADPLSPDATYHLLLEAGSQTGQLDFQTRIVE